MKLLVLTMTLMMSSLAIADELSCTISDLDIAIINQQKIVPKKIYHYGKKEILKKDIAARTIPENDWNEFIMGDKTTWKLNPSRRGFYGTSGLDTNTFANEALIEISIKDECREPSRVASILNVHEDPRFVRWYNSQKSLISLNEFAHICAFDSESEESYQGYTDGRCEVIVDKYLKDLNFGVVLDHVVKKSFYIRDRNCIETIRGTPEEVIEIFATTPELWVQQCDMYWPILIMSTPEIIKNAIIEVPSIDTGMFSKLREMGLMFGELFLEFLDKAHQCRVNKDLACKE